jgi:hypothetical protein
MKTILHPLTTYLEELAMCDVLALTIWAAVVSSTLAFAASLGW